MSALTEDDEDELWRLLKPGSARKAAATQSNFVNAASVAKSTSSNLKPKTKLSRAEDKLEKLEKELVSLQSQQGMIFPYISFHVF